MSSCLTCAPCTYGTGEERVSIKSGRGKWKKGNGTTLCTSCIKDWLGKPARSSIEAAAKLLQTKNDSLQHPLSSRELQKIIRRGPESAVPGHQYDVGCESIHRLLDGFGWMDCKGCKYADERARKVLNAAQLGIAASSLSAAAFDIYLALLDEEIRTGVRFLSINAAVKATNLSRNTVRSALQELRVASYLMEGGSKPDPTLWT